MTQLRLDEPFTKKLHELDGPVELCDPAGRLLGMFIPAADSGGWEPISPGVSDAELDRREQANERRYTTAEVLTRLESR